MPKRSLTPSKPAPGPTAAHTGKPPRVAIVVSRYNATVTDRLLSGAVDRFQAATGTAHPAWDVYSAPGAFETVALSHAAAECRVYDGVVALGCIIKGETTHDEVLGHAVTQGLANISLVTGVPVGLGVLTVNTSAQALARAGGKQGNKGAEAMGALLATLAEMKRIHALGGRAAGSFEIDLSSLGVSPDKLGSSA